MEKKTTIKMKRKSHLATVGIYDCLISAVLNFTTNSQPIHLNYKYEEQNEK